MTRPKLEVADIFRDHGPAWRRAAKGVSGAGHVSLAQLKVMSAIEACRTAALGGHVAACTSCDHQHIAYNSCRNRHCPKCQGPAARDWMAARAADLLPVPYYHVVFTLPAPAAEIAYANKAVVYDLLFKASAETLMTIAADPRHLGAKIGMTSVLHTWGSALTHHPHIHIIVPGGGLSPDGEQWLACRPGFFLPVKVLSRLFRRLFLTGLEAAHRAGRLKFFGDRAGLADPDAFAAHIAPLSRSEWVVYAKAPFGGPEAVLAYLSRYTHRVAISNSRLIAADARTVTFRWQDYRAKNRDRQKTMRLETDEFIRRFLLHVLPTGFHRIRHAACPGPDPGGCLPAPGANGISRPSAICSTPRRRKPTTTMSPKPPCQDRSANPAQTAAGRCASWRRSSAARRPDPAPRQREPPHDTEITIRAKHRPVGTSRQSPRPAAHVPTFRGQFAPPKTRTRSLSAA